MLSWSSLGSFPTVDTRACANADGAAVQNTLEKLESFSRQILIQTLSASPHSVRFSDDKQHPCVSAMQPNRLLMNHQDTGHWRENMLTLSYRCQGNNWSIFILTISKKTDVVHVHAAGGEDSWDTWDRMRHKGENRSTSLHHTYAVWRG